MKWQGWILFMAYVFYDTCVNFPILFLGSKKVINDAWCKFDTCRAEKYLNIVNPTLMYLLAHNNPPKSVYLKWYRILNKSKSNLKILNKSQSNLKILNKSQLNFKILNRWQLWLQHQNVKYSSLYNTQQWVKSTG